MELTTVADDEVVLFGGGKLRSTSGLAPDSVHEIDGRSVRTLPRHGELLCTVATVNDVHFGEVECGVIGGTDIGPVFSSAPGDEPYPELMNRGAVAEIQAIAPTVVVVKGDLTSSGTDEQYQQFLDVYGGAFGDRLLHVRGNHDSYHGAEFANAPFQERVVPGAVIALLDTARTGRANGALSDEQLEWLDELAVRADAPVLVFGHHHVWSPQFDPRTDDFFGIRPADSEALFAVFARRPNLVGYFAGHTHRNRRIVVPEAGGAPFVEVACVKDFPGAVAEYRIHEGGISQVFRRIADPAALLWSERTRHMYEGAYAEYAFGRIGDRCFSIPTR